MANCKKRILIDLTNLSPSNHGGVPTFAKGIVSGFSALKSVDVSILGKSNLSLAEFQGNTKILVSNKMSKGIPKLFLHFLILINQKKIYSWFKNLEIKKVMQINSFDYIYTPTTYINYKIDHIPTLVSLHDIQEKDYPENFSVFDRMYRNFFVNFTLQNSSKIHVSSDFIKNTIVRHYGRKYKNVDFVVVREGVDIKFFEPNLTKERMFIFPARAWKHKNHQVFFSALKDSRELKDFKFIVTGASTSDFEKIGVKVPKNVEVAGLIDLTDLRNIYSKAFCVISCSRYESSSLPLLEGVASGCRIIASNIPAHLEMAAKFQFTLFNTESSEELLKSITTMISDFGSTSSELVTIENFEALKSSDWTLIAEDLLEFLEKCYE
jgi:glycosyltransferase involved in cell wall biosynthesis